LVYLSLKVVEEYQSLFGGRIVEKVRFLVLCGAILSACVLLAVAAEPAEVNESTTEETTTHAEGMEEAEAEATEPNSPEARLARAWADVERAVDSEAKHWLELEMAKRVEFAKAAQRATEAQLHLLRMIAESEGAMQTVAAVDKIVEVRAARVDEVLDEAREARRQERLKEMEERRKAREEMRKNRRERMGQ
jgi:hypothetical protein